MARHLSEEHKRKLSECRMGKNNPFYGKKHTKETRKKMSRTLRGKNHPFYGKHLSDETKKKLSEINTGKNNPFFGKKHTKETLKKMSKAHQGLVDAEKNPNWNPNLTDEERLDNRRSSTTKAWRNGVCKRDNYTCQRCGIKNIDMEAHHMENFSDNLVLRSDINNGITFCKNCHLQFHRVYGFHHTTAQQTEEFIRNYKN